MLRFKRLGRHERLQLLSAGDPTGAAEPIYPPGPAPSEQTATRRAVATLVAHGLIDLDSESARLVAGRDDATLRRLGRKYAVVRSARRTIFGEEIVRRYRQELEGGERIRWIRHLDAATEAALMRCPERSSSGKARSGKRPVRLVKTREGRQEAGG